MIYVDALFKVDPSTVKDRRARILTAKHGQWCHLFADEDEELLRFAARLGLRLAWVQKFGTAEAHFDLVPSRRAAAVRMGAKEIDRTELVKLIHGKRAKMPPPPARYPVLQPTQGKMTCRPE